MSKSSTETPWWERHPVRAQREEDLRRENTKAKMKIEDGEMVWTEIIHTCCGGIFAVAFVTQKDHPFSPPRAYITHPEIDTSTVPHTWAEGHLDLVMEQDMDSNTTILDIRNWTVLWITCYQIHINTREWVAPDH